MDGIGRMDPVGGLVAPAVATIAPTATLKEAADAMASNGLGLLVVIDAKGPTGVISERDLVIAISDALDLAIERVRDHCTDEIVAVDESVSVEDAARAMAEAQIRHLAVSRDGSVYGVVSVRDVLGVLFA